MQRIYSNPAEKSAQIAAENVGQRNFTWRIEYFGNEEKKVEMAPGDHANHECLCVPMDMYVDYEVSVSVSALLEI